jgi:hypothetical protein
MFFTVVTSIATICIGVMLVWGWVAFIAEAIARRTGRTSAVPYPDEALWACFGRSLLDIGLFGGEFSLTQRRKGNLLLRGLRGRLSRSQNIVLGAGPDTEAEQHAVLHNAGASEACPSGEGVNVAHRV